LARTHILAPVLLTLAFATLSNAQPDATLIPSQLIPSINCDEVGTGFCLDRHTRLNYEGNYVGHDEPSMIFYSSRPGSGSQSIYYVILPQDPPTAPEQGGAGGTYNFQLHPSFWFGMALCDTQSAPVPDKDGVCIPNSDANIADSTNFSAPNYVGNHAGTAFLELQFYPPGWINSPQLASARSYFAAMNIDSLSVNMLTNQDNNKHCLNRVGQEPVNFAVLTKNGIPLAPANPLGAAFGTSSPDLTNVLLMHPGDRLRVTITDTAGGVLALVEDLTTNQSGFIVGGPDSGFGQVDFDPSANKCTISPYAFHPMYSTSSESTRVPWAAHSYNIAFADEIGHFEFCDGFVRNPNSPSFLACNVPGAQDFSVDSDDFPCANPKFLGLPPSFVPVTGCVGNDVDFDGTAYGLNWPGTGNLSQDPNIHPSPIQFTSPQFTTPFGLLANYDRIAFETDLPSIEPACDVKSGIGCTNPPAGAPFYPIFSSTVDGSHKCWWQLGGPDIPGTLNNYGGTSDVQFGDLLTLAYPTSSGPSLEKLNFRQTLGNPCLEPPYFQ
jgi:hypothetical protein